MWRLIFHRGDRGKRYHTLPSPHREKLAPRWSNDLFLPCFSLICVGRGFGRTLAGAPTRFGMTSEQLQSAIELFDTASELTPGERGGYLLSACAGDQELRAQVELLLLKHEQAEAEDFLADPVLPDSDPQAFSLVGRHIGPYALLRELGGGGMGGVYLAVRADDLYRKEVAVKLVWPGMQREAIVRRFKQERRILASLDHPNIARLLDGGATEEGWPYVVMEYVDGMPITEYCDARRLDITERLKLFRTVCAAVAYAHQNLIVHRDLKPGNIFVTTSEEKESGTVKLLDFGIAKLLGSEPQADLTRTGLHLLTPEYASPEQLRGETITTSSDIYSLGVALYELLTGHRPYRLKSPTLPEIARVITETEPETPSDAISRVITETDSEGNVRVVRSPETVSASREGNPEKLRRRLAGDLNNIALMALRKEAGDRYASVSQLSEDIDNHLARRPVMARKPTLLYRTGKFVRRNKARTALAALLFVVLIAGVLAGMIRLKNAEAEAKRRWREIYSSNIKLASDYWKDGDYSRMRSLLAQYLPGQSGNAGEEDLRGFEWYYLWRLLNRDRITLHYETEIHSTTASPDGRIIATGMRDGSAVLRDASTGQEIITIPGNGFIVRSLRFSPDGKKILTGDADGIARIWDVATGTALMTVRGQENGRVLSVSFSPDGRSFLTGGEDTTANLWDTATGEKLLSLKGHNGWVSAVDISPDGRLLATGSVDSKVKLWELPTGKLRATLTGSRDGVWQVRFTADGRYIVADGLDSPAVLWRVSDGRLARTFSGTPQGGHALSVSPDGETLAIVGTDHTVKLFDIGSGREIASFKGHETYVGSSAFVSNGRGVATADDRTVKIWDIESTRDPDQIRICRECGIRSISLSPDGKTFAVGEGKDLPPGSNARRSVTLWNVDSAELIGTLGARNGFILDVKFSPDGGKLATVSSDECAARLWDVAALKESAIFSLPNTGARAVTISHNGLLVGASDGHVGLWDIANGRQLSLFKAHSGYINSMDFSPDGRHLVTGSDESHISHDNDARLKVWGIPSGQELLTIREGVSNVRSVRFSPNGALIASGNIDKTVRIYDAVTGKLLLTLEGHADEVYGLAFTHDSRRLATSGRDQKIRIWDVHTGQELLRLEGHTKQVRSLAFSAKDDMLLSGSFDGMVRIWRAATEEQVRARIGK